MRHWEYGVTAACWSFVSVALIGGWTAIVVISCTPAERQDVQTIATTVEPVLSGLLCQLAADQGSAEPGWEVLACSVLDASGKPGTTMVQLKLPKVVAEAALESQAHHLSPLSPPAPALRPHLGPDGT